MYQEVQRVEDEAEPARLAVHRLSLCAFRNYGDLCLTFDSSPVVFTGQNGSGKTNVLEALSLLVPGRGLRRASLAELQRKTDAAPWAVAADISTPTGGLRIGTGRDVEAMEVERRVVHIDGRPARNQQSLADHVVMAWVTPDMDRLLVDGASARRRFLDKLVCGFDPAHAGRILRYEKALRERLSLLRDGICDMAWLSALEDTLAKSGVAIAAARGHMLRELQFAIDESAGVFPQAELELKGIAEGLLASKPALLVEDHLRAAYALTRGDDAQSGTSSIGVHRTDLLVKHRNKNCPADLCSTGEQKALLVSVMLAFVRLLISTRQVTPIFLLDDITAHLDEVRREALFDEVLSLGVQAWMTGTDSLPFASLKSAAQHFRVINGSIES